MILAYLLSTDSNMCPNAYYNYRKHRKADYYTRKSKVQAQIREIYHEHNGVDGYRSMTVYLARNRLFFVITYRNLYHGYHLGSFGGGRRALK